LFGIVLGLFAWIYLIAELTVYAAELNVVLAASCGPRHGPATAHGRRQALDGARPSRTSAGPNSTSTSPSTTAGRA